MISVVIRTRDKERFLDRLLENLAMQTVQASEIIIVDNYSTIEKRRVLEDVLSEIVKRCFKHRVTKFKFTSLTDYEFSHAYSTNLGVSLAENELVCITNAHSLPISLRWLQDGIRYFEDSKIAGVGGFFVPNRETIAGKRINNLYRFSQKMVLYQDGSSSRFATTNCIIRKSLWKTYPFDENLPKLIPETRKYGLEDYDWSIEMAARGFKITVDPAFSVFHSHDESFKEIKRNVKRYFVYRRIQRRISLFQRPKASFSRVFQEKVSFKEIVV